MDGHERGKKGLKKKKKYGKKREETDFRDEGRAIVVMKSGSFMEVFTVPVADAVLMTRSLDDGSHRKTVASRRLW
jgi:hypothetical protein